MSVDPALRRRCGLIALILVVMPLFGVDLILPAMPTFGRELKSSVAASQFTLSAFAFSFALMHILLGPLADRYGRRPCLLACLALYTLASAACAFATSIEVLVAARAVQGLGAAGGPLIARAVIRDVYGAEGAGRMMGYVMAFFGAGAILTPIAGGILVDTFGWQSCFYVCALYGASMLAVSALRLPETLPALGPGMVHAKFGRGFITLLGDRRFTVVAAGGCLIASGMFCWIAGSSFAIQNVFGYSATMHGVLYGATVGGFVLSSFITARLAPRLGSYRLLRFGTAIAALGGILGIALGLGTPLTLTAMLLAVSLMALGHGFTLPQSMAASVAPFPFLAATASALFGFLQYGFNSLVVLLNGTLYDGTAVPMLGIIAGLTVSGFLLYAVFRPRNH